LSNELYQIRSILNTLAKNNNSHEELKLVQEIIDYAEAYKECLIKLSAQNYIRPAIKNDTDIKIEKISEESFLYKAVAVKKYNDGLTL